MTRERPSPRKVTVVVPAFNAEDTIGDQLAALAAQTYTGDWEVAVSDNGSTDRTVDVAREWAPRLPALRIVDSSQQRGVAHARNVAARSAGDVLAFCDADDVVEPQWLEALAEAVQRVDIVCGVCEHFLLNDRAISDARGFPTTELPRTYDFLPYAVGGNCAVRRDVFDALGGWNPKYPRAEDVDFCWRAQLAGHTVGFAERAIIHIRHRNSLRAVARQVYDYARAEVGLYRDYRDRGARRRSPREVAKAYAYLLLRLPYLALTRRRRGFWLVSAAENAGRLVGSFEQRVFCP